MDDKECALCDKMMAGFGILLGLVCLYISVDILSGSRITSMFSSRTEYADDIAD